MKKRILSILLALCMLFCLVPTTAFAEGETNRKVETEQELVAALADGTADVIRLTKDIDISNSLTILRKVTLDLNGHVLKMTGSVIILDNKSGTTGDLTLIDSNPTAEHKFKVNGAEPWVLDDSGTETVYGGIITGGTGSRIFFSNGVEGGGVIIGSGALTMNGGNIVGCIANEGGGLFLSDGSFTMNAGSIVGCSTPNRLTTGEAFYGGIYAFGPMANRDTTGVITLTGGLIKNNGRYAINAAYMTTIYANGGEVYGEVHLNQACKITCLAEDNGITAFKGKTVIGGTSSVNPSHVDWGLFYGGLYIYGNMTGVIVTYKDGDNEYAKQVLPSGTLATRPDDPTKPGYIFDGWYTSDGAQWDYTTAVTENITVTARWTLKTQSVSSEQELNDALADISVGKILLTADIGISSSLTVNRKVTLDLNGYVLRYANTAANGSVFKIVSGGDLTVIDSRPDAEHRFNSNNALWAPDEPNGKEIVMGGVITGGTGTPCYVNGSSYFVACGGGVYLEGDARFTMDGGNIVGCIANTGGGVYISENGSFTMNGGSIMGCSSWDLSGPGGTPYFGGVYLDSGTFTMTGGVIKDCAKYSVVLNENATMNANGGEIYGVVEVGKNSYVTCLDGLTGVTAFRDNFWIYHNSARVDRGIFYGSITNYYDDTIIGLTVTYKDGDSEYAKQVLPSGTLATRPDAPAATPGYTFGGWNKADGTAWDYASDKVTDNITLYAKWAANTYTITFDTAGGSEIAPITQDYGTAITVPADPTREGYTFIGWDKEIPTTMPAENMTVTAQWEINQYTITFDTAGGSEIAPITQDYGTVITAPADPTREGYTFIGWDKEIPATMPAENITLKARWKDIEKPTGEIIIGTNKWHSFLNKLTLGLFFKETQEVTINAFDNSGTVFVSYLVTDWDLSEAELQSLVFSGYEEPFCIDPNGEYIVYAMLVDESLNITYLRSDRITLDNIRPVISGIEDGKTYCEAQTVTIDEKYIDTVTVNGTKVTLDENGGFTLSPADGEQKIIVTDKAGNTAEMTVTVNGGHTYGEWVSNGDGTHTHKCTVDGCNGFETKECSGGKATCTEKAVCEVCGKAYGKPDPNNHTDLKHIDAKAATKTAEGNIEYWYCGGCDKYYSGKDGINEIKKADTVTAKLPGDPKSPRTGNASDLALWISLLLVSGGVTGVAAALRKKKKHKV
jgi:uncharacterized repeat protein (TIGR02543 family)